MCTGLPGGAAVLRKNTFFEVGAFEKRMFIGFEDTELSLRLFQKGLKVASIGEFCLIHDHPKFSNEDSLDYERKRFSKEKLKESAKIFERKHGLYVWTNEVENWIEKRKEEIGIQRNEKSEIEPTRLKKIALVVDVPGWAFDNIARQIKKKAPKDLEIKIVYESDFGNVVDIFRTCYDCDLIHFFWRGRLAQIQNTYVDEIFSEKCLDKKSFIASFVSNKIITTSVYDHLCMGKDDRWVTDVLFFNKSSFVTAYTVSSKKLYDFYNSLEGIEIKPAVEITDGVDLELFYPLQHKRSYTSNGKPFVFGWTGNSKWHGFQDLKGITTIIEPAIRELQEEGWNIKLKKLDRAEVGIIDHSKMPSFYHGIDCYICASISEGTPNTVLEAMACGLPVITTDVGIVKEVAGSSQARLILSKREVKQLKNKIVELLSNSELLEKTRNENIESISKWSWETKAEEFIDFFREYLKKSSL